MISPFIKQNIVMFLASERHEDLVRLAELVEQGVVTPQLDQVLPLEQAPAAMELLEKGQVHGKVALAVQN